MIYLNQILFKYYEHLGRCYILYYIDIHKKELKSIQPLFLNPGTWLLFVGRSTGILLLDCYSRVILFIDICHEM